MNLNNNEKVPLMTKLIFGSGDIYGGGASIIITFFYAIYLTDIARISPIFAGMIVLVGKIWDAISDPLMGMITDRTRSRFGRRRPYFMIGIPLIFTSFVMLWFPVPFKNDIARFLFVFSGYFLHSTIITLVMIPYSALLPEISPNYHERTSIMGVRLAFSFTATLLCAVLPMEIVKRVREAGMSEAEGFLIMSLIFGVLFAVPYLLISIFIKEKIQVSQLPVKSFTVKSFFEPLRIRSFRQLIGIYLFTFLAMDIQSTLIAYFMKYHINPSETPSSYTGINMLSTVLGLMVVVQLLCLPVYTFLAKKIEKNRAYIVGATIWMCGVVLLSMANPIWPEYIIYLLAALLGVGVSGAIMIPWSMFPDTTDVGELATGQRIEGSFSGIMTFCRKVSSAFSIFFIMFALQFLGYLTPDQKIARHEVILAKFQNEGVLTEREVESFVKVLDLQRQQLLFKQEKAIEANIDHINVSDVRDEYVKIVEQRNNAARVIRNYQETSIVLTIRVLLSAIPLLLLSIASYIAARYRLTAKIHEKLRQYLAFQRNKEVEKKLSDHEVEELKRLLI